MPTATLETPLPTLTPTPARVGAQDDAASADSTSRGRAGSSGRASSGTSTGSPSTRPSSVRPARHLPRRPATATSRLRAIDTRALDLGPQRFGEQGDDARGHGDERRQPDPKGADRSERAVRSLSLRELVTGAGTAAGAWTLAAHLGLLGTAGGVFLISVVSTTGVALVADSLTGARRMLIRLVRGARRRRAHRRRTSVHR